MSDRLAKAICRTCGENVYFFVDTEDSGQAVEMTCPNGHSDSYSGASSKHDADSKPAGKLTRREVAAAAG